MPRSRARRKDKGVLPVRKRRAIRNNDRVRGPTALSARNFRDKPVPFLPPAVVETANDILPRLEAQNIEYMIVGALPVNVYGRHRLSSDIDLALVLNKIEQFRNIFPQSRYKLNSPDVIDANTRVAKMRDMCTGILVDVLLKPSEFTFDSTTFTRKVKVRIDGLKAFIPSVEDYLISKFQAARRGSQDFQDIVSTIRAQRNSIIWEYLEHRAEQIGKLDVVRYYRQGLIK
jgi:predicted nucleotidyltransferase